MLGIKTVPIPLLSHNFIKFMKILVLKNHTYISNNRVKLALVENKDCTHSQKNHILK